MPFRVSYGFQMQAEKLGGWTENFWSALPDLPSVETALNQLKPKLVNAHGNAVIMNEIRISNADTFRDVKVLLVNASIVGTPVATEADYPTNALLLKLTGQGNYVTRQWIKGIWDSIIRDNGRYVPTANYIAVMNQIFAELLNSSRGWVMRVTDRGVPFKPVKDITQAGVVTVTNHGYADNAKVRISRVKGLTQANDLWRITRLDADTFQLQGWVAPVPASPYLGRGLARLTQFIYVPIQQAVIVRATEHAVGRPLGLLSGRRKSRRR